MLLIQTHNNIDVTYSHIFSPVKVFKEDSLNSVATVGFGLLTFFSYGHMGVQLNLIILLLSCPLKALGPRRVSQNEHFLGFSNISHQIPSLKNVGSSVTTSKNNNKIQ